MRVIKHGAALSAISIALAGCHKAEQASQNASATVNAVEARGKAEVQVPETIFEGYPVSIAKAVNAQKEAISKASQSTHAGFSPYYLILQTRTWKPGSTITVAFFGGSPQVRSQIEQVAKAWTTPSIANLTLSFRDANGNFRQWSPTDQSYSADVRIAFASDPDNGGYWSAIGLDSRDPKLFAPQQASMNLDSFDKGLPQDWQSTALHEFGHALGFEHEHQSPKGGCDFRYDDDPGYVKTQNSAGWFIPDANGRRPGLYTYLGGPLNYWSHEKVDLNLRQFPSSSAFLMGGFDRSSIMLYAFDPFMFVHGDKSACYVPRQAAQISPQDKVGASRAYPASAKAAAQVARKADLTLSSLANSNALPANVRAGLQKRVTARAEAAER